MTSAAPENPTVAEMGPSASPEEFGAFVMGEIAKWAKAVKAAGTQPG